jgi:hypothetical protein
VSLAVRPRLLRKQGRVNSAEHDERAALAGEATHLIAPQRVRRVNADPDDVSGTNRHRLERMQSFVDDVWVTETRGSGSGQHVEPPWRDDGNTEREIARVDKMHAHQNDPPIDLPRRLKKPAVATAAFCEPRPIDTPASAIAPQGVTDDGVTG